MAPSGVTNKRREEYLLCGRDKNTTRLLFLMATLGKCILKEKAAYRKPEWNCVTVNVIISSLMVVSPGEAVNIQCHLKVMESGRLLKAEHPG